MGDGATGDNDNFIHQYEKEGSYNVTIIGERSSCVYQKTTTLPVYTLKIPNVITPDKDGKNDVFTIQYGSVEGITPAVFGFPTSLTVYNRWGRTVYQNDDYHYDWSGEGLAEGVYYYEVTVKEHAVCRNWLHILR